MKADESGSDNSPVVLFADVTDSSRLYATYGDAGARRMVADCLLFLESVVAENGGRVVKTIGDEIMCVFPAPDPAVTAAIQLHARLREQTRTGALHGSLSIRVGFHAGPVVEEKGDVFGDAVNLAARMASLSKAHQSLTTRQTIDRVGPALRPLARFVDQSMIKGQSREFDLYEILWDVEEATQATTRTRAPTPDVTISLRIELGEKTWVVDRVHPVLTLGRSEQCDVVVDDTRASRLHAKIEFHRDKILLRDVSTNGTHVALETTGKQQVRRAELALESSGMLCLGREIDPASPIALRLTFKKEAVRL